MNAVTSITFFRLFLISGLIHILTCSGVAEDSTHWIRHSAIAPDGKSIAFSYQGDIYRVSTAGGLARALTQNAAWDGHPVWSRDSQTLAFASDRHGNLDIFVMAAEGGKANRMTYHSSDDIPSDFSISGNAILFSSARTDSDTASLFPTSRLAELYEVELSGGTPRMVTTIPTSQARYSKDGQQIFYRDEKGYESEFRKHDVSAFARDIWSMNLKTGKHQQLTRHSGGDHDPHCVGNLLYYLSEDQTNNFNVWVMNLDGGKKRKLTAHETHPVRHLSVSDNHTLGYTRHGELFVHKAGAPPKQLALSFLADSQANDYELKSLSEVAEFSVSPSGNEIAIVSRGEIFVVSTEFGTTVRVTDTPEQERSVSFAPDGRTLLYAAERDGKWKIYESSMTDDREKYFFAATSIVEKEIYSSESESFQPSYSPDGTKIAFLAGRDEIQILDRKTGDTNVALSRIHNYSYTDGDITYGWSPDSQLLTADYAPRDRLFVPNIAIFPSDGSKEPVDISHSGYTDSSPHWNKSGNVVYWASARFGQRDHGSWGREYDIMAAFLTQDAFDEFQLSKEEYELAKELTTDNAGNKPDTEESDQADQGTVEEVIVDWQGLDDRTIRLTKDSANITQAYLISDTSKLYFLKQHSAGSELWMRDFRDDNTEMLQKLDRPASFEFSEDEQSIFVLSGGRLSKAAVDSIGDVKPIMFKAVMTLKTADERAYMFEHAWRQIKDKFYNPNFHGINWDVLKDAYQSKLPSISNNRDLANLMAEMTGELNASHIGVSYRPGKLKGADETAELGVLFDQTDTSGPLVISEVLDKSPLRTSNSRIKAGMRLSAVNGVPLDGTHNLAKLLNHKTGKRVRLSIVRQNGTKFDEVTTPISPSAQSQLMYERWVKTRRQLVEKLSAGRLGYVHVRGMNDASFRTVYSEVLGRNFDKEAIIIDTRWNGGGWLHNDLAKLFMGKEYVTMHVRGREYRGDSLDQWNKPSILVMGEGNYSDAHAFPYTYDVLNIGEMVGMPVPGTMTAVWWEMSLSGDIRVGVPQVGMKNTKGEYLENNQTEPDHRVKNDPESTEQGKDRQIEKAVEVMLRKLGRPKQKAEK